MFLEIGIVSQFGWIQYPSVFLSEHDPELAKGKCESKDPDTASFAMLRQGVLPTPVISLSATRFSKTSYGENSLKPHGQKTYPRDPSTRARPASGTHTCSGRQ